MQYLFKSIFFIKELGCKTKLAQIDLKVINSLVNRFTLYSEQHTAPRDTSTTTLQQTILLFRLTVPGWLETAVCNLITYGKASQKITEAAPQLTDDLRREGSVKVLNPFPVLLSSLLTLHPNTPKGSASHSSYLAKTLSKYSRQQYYFPVYSSS